MYRSRSTSSVYAGGALYEFKPETPPTVSNKLHLTYEPEAKSRRPEAESPTVAWSMNSAAKLPTHVGRRPLPKALLPKAARGGPATPPSMGGTVFRISNQKPGPSYPHAPDVRTPSVHRVSGSPALRDSGYGSLSSDLSRVGMSAPVCSPSPPLFGGTERASTAASRTTTDDYSAGNVFRFHSMEETHASAWYPPGNIRPLRRKDPVIEDSIYPILKAALAKDREPEDGRTEDKRTEDEVVREAFRRPDRVLSPSPSSPVPPSRNLYSSYSSADDVFAAASSEATTMTSSSRVENHSKSNSEIVVSNRLSSSWQPQKQHSGADARLDCPPHLSASLHTLPVERDLPETLRASRGPGSDKILAESASRTFEVTNRRNNSDPDLDLGLGLDLDPDDAYPVHLTTPEDPGLYHLPLPPPPLGFRDADFSTGAASSPTPIASPSVLGGVCLEAPPGERSFNQPPFADENSSKMSRSVGQDGERKSQSDESQSSVTREEEGEGEMEEGQGRELVVDIVKGPVGVGFCIEGGRGSLSGDRPITVKRIFKGGFGDDASVALFPGDELVSVGGQSMDAYSHFDAWKFIKALPNGNIQLTIRRRIAPSLNILSPPVGFKTFA